MLLGAPEEVGTGNSARAPEVVRRPIFPGEFTIVNQRFPSGPKTMPEGPELVVNSWATLPKVWNRLTLPAPNWVNHSDAPEDAMPEGSLPAGRGYSTMLPEVVIAPILKASDSVNQSRSPAAEAV